MVAEVGIEEPRRILHDRVKYWLDLDFGAN